MGYDAGEAGQGRRNTVSECVAFGQRMARYHRQWISDLRGAAVLVFVSLRMHLFFARRRFADLSFDSHMQCGSRASQIYRISKLGSVSTCHPRGNQVDGLPRACKL